LKIAIGLPAHNEEKNIAAIIMQLRKTYPDVIVCDDGSSDNTGEIARDMGATLISNPKNMGYGAAIKALFVKAKEIDVDVLVTFDSDGQHRIEDIEYVLEPILKNDADIVIGSRFIGKDRFQGPRYRGVGIKAITRLSNSSTGSNIKDSQSGFRAYNKKALQGIIPSEHGMGVSTEILFKAAKQNLRITEVPITISYDGDTSTHHPVSHGVSVILSTMKFISIEHPLKFYGIPGMVLLSIGLFFVLWSLQIFTEQGRFITNIVLIGIGGMIAGTVLLMTSVILYSIIGVVREEMK